MAADSSSRKGVTAKKANILAEEVIIGRVGGSAAAWQDSYEYLLFRGSVDRSF